MPLLAAMLLAVLAVIPSVFSSPYQLVDTYDETNFFDHFDFFSKPDPTNGFVDYKDRETSSSQGLAGFHKNMIYIGSDHKTINPKNGRASTRVNSKKSYNQMLLVADLVHMPVGCGTWPALWTYNEEWPTMGEIDILEGANSQECNQVTLHTGPGCTMTQGKTLDGTQLHGSGNCNAGNAHDGCPQLTTSVNNFGKGLNAAGGGIYAMLWDDDAISVWFFPRNSTIHSRLSSVSGAVSGTASGTVNGTAKGVVHGTAKGIVNGTAKGVVNGTVDGIVDPTTFGLPMASFVGGSGCEIAETFKDHWITINTDFCGEWAGSRWTEDAECAAKAPTCEQYAKDPKAFVDAYWLFNSIKVYTKVNNGRPAKRHGHRH